VIAREPVLGAPDHADHAGVAEQRVDGGLDLLDPHDLAHGPIGLDLGAGVEQEVTRAGEAVARIDGPHLGGAARQAAAAVVPPVRRDPVPRGRRRVRLLVEEAGPGLEVDRGAVGGQRAHRQPDGDVAAPAARDVELEPHPRGGRDPRLVVDQAGQPHQRPALRRRLDPGLGRDPVLLVAQIVGERGERLEEHHAEVGLGPLLPGRVAQRREVEEGALEAGEVLGEVVDGGPIVVEGRAGRRIDLAVERRRTAGLEREVDAIEERIERGRGQRQRVDREVAG
jgi:hypothetical protein